MRKLISLEYFIFSEKGNNQLTQMPREVSRFSKLKELSVFIVGIGKGYGIEELKHLNLLGGKLVIKNLGNVTEANQANLMGKENITHLKLHWDSRIRDDSDSGRRYEKDNRMINDLKPHQNLKKLEISNFAGSKLPAWMMSTSIHLPDLVYLTLQNCGNCEHLPALGRLQSLRFLRMESMDAIKQIGNEFYPTNGEASFPSLAELHLCCFPNLEEWLGDQQSSASSFPCLETMEISDCPKLSTTPTEFPSLKKLKFSIELLNRPNFKSLPLKLFRGANNVLQTLRISSCDAFVGFLPDNDQEQQLYQPYHLSNNFLSVIEIWRCASLTVLPADFRGLSSLTYLAIKECRSLKSLPDGIQYLPALQKLIIGGFSKDLISFPFPAPSRLDGEPYFISLRELTILGWPTLAVLPAQLQYLISLHRLKISDFPCLLSLPEWFGELSSLQTLDIENCSRLEYLPSEEQMRRITSLQNLNIRNCPLLLEKCRSGNEEWHKIAHLSSAGRSSSSLIDHITRDADMKIELLARRRFGIFSNENKEKCWIDSSGRNCFMLFPKSLHITWGDNTDYWTWLSIIEPSASDDAEIEVPELVKVCWLSVHGKLDMSKLSPGVNYEVVFVVMFREWSDGWSTPVDLCLMLPDGQRPVRKVNLETMPKSQWVEIHVGDFKSPQQPDDEETEASFWLLEQEVLNWKKGLVIEGAIVRPKK
ncbi:hypothetical protein MKW92_042861 [Papaver armeniacum]|nr:hypothetical protein MKW92_042861 [Papaver armeniacum]